MIHGWPNRDLDVEAVIGVTVAQLAIAWVLAKAKDIVPLVGARTRDRQRTRDRLDKYGMEVTGIR